MRARVAGGGRDAGGVGGRVDKLIIIPTKIIDKSNVDAFWAELKERQGKK